MRDPIDRLLAGTHPRPDALLGRHDGVLRALLPGADQAWIDGAEMRRIRGPLLEGTSTGDSTMQVRYGDHVQTVHDPYRVPSRLTDDDRRDIRLGAGFLVDLLGSFPVDDGVHFAVWAPNARGVTVFGDFDSWGAGSFPMVLRDGVWEVFVPGARIGDRYKYRVVGADGLTRDKADPLAHRTQRPPETASIVTAPSEFEWSDATWLGDRVVEDHGRVPFSAYEVHLGSWRRGLDYRLAARLLADHLTDLNITHVQLLPVTEHPYGPSWGYQVGSFFAPTARFGEPDDLRFLVDHLHSRGLGVILDWVPAHFPKDTFALGEFDGTPLYEHADPLRRDQPDWGTYAFNLGRDEVRAFLLASADYWCREFHVDGLRVDAVAAMLYRDYSRGEGHWRPAADGSHRNEEAVDFLSDLTDLVHDRHPGVMMIAEESTAWPGVTTRTEDGGLGFDFKWDLGWMHTTLGHFAAPTGDGVLSLAASLSEASRERYVLPLSHDEMVHGKGTLVSRMPGDDLRTRADHVRTLLAYQWAHPGKKLLFMGQEFAQVDEWSDHRGLDWDLLHGDDGPVHRGVTALVRDLGRLLRKTPALYAGDCDATGLDVLTANDTSNQVIGFVRRDPAGDGLVACLFNFSDADLPDYRIGLPRGGRWAEVLNSGALDYQGRGLGNFGAVDAEARPSHGRPFSASITLPARSSIWLVPS
ncbi:1,4-alpha-glucan branching enzyme [Gordonia malaquae]|uniref:1,4-alpha-glucan branching enzyme n=1 Tax=Gordonia malaquae NBRC 108250 TaxID=1223542 RepID=M3VFE3_GORML|nr:1,4-alpha-glucan branching protein GlgB [Gordonia malaquae]GAC80029.1 1,4-alpha-glucan-branching enzyme [Gordonia malaquae NBRC 108250]SEC33199.1 1,4-alpha-glucan branching enzyme [Gordonia malaquae]